MANSAFSLCAWHRGPVWLPRPRAEPSRVQGQGLGGLSKPVPGLGAHPVKVIEGGPELIHLFLADALGIPGQNLVLHLIDGPGDGGEELFPAHTDVLKTGGQVSQGDTWARVSMPAHSCPNFGNVRSTKLRLLLMFRGWLGHQEGQLGQGGGLCLRKLRPEWTLWAR